ncbi:MAG: beta-lactamase family protein [Sediminibacterium sp.]|nr:beta-lactamase family protein [Sediminibacterium sp.]
MKKYTSYAVLIHLMLLLISNQLVAQNDPSQKIESAIQQMMQSNPVVGLSVAVVKNNKIIYNHSFGFKDLEQQIPLNNQNIFRIASISKSFTATAMMQLVAKKQVSLDQDVSELIGFKVRNPKFPNKVITLKMILSHRSSINDSEGYFNLDAIDPSKNPNWANCYNAYEPNKGYMYCNLNYNMAGAILERITGKRFDLYIKQQILDPLGLYGGYNVNLLDSNLFAKLYEYKKDSAKFINAPDAYTSRKEEINNYTIGRTTPIFSPTGGMKISAHDLAEYMIMHSQMGKHKGVRIMPKKLAKQMQQVLSAEEGYGMAIETTKKLIKGKAMIGHTGSAYGLNSIMFFEPKEKFGIVVISNGTDRKTYNGYIEVLHKTVNLLYENLIR